MKRYFKMILAILVATYLSICGVVYAYQRSLLYHPTAEVPIDGIQQMDLEVDGAKLKVSYREIDSDNAIIYFGGNAENVAQSLPDYTSAFPNHAVYMLHYRGFSGSTGEPTETDLHQDAAKLYDLVKAKHSHITAMGRSLGSGVAIRLAAEKPVDKLVLITPYKSILSIAELQYSFLPVGLMLKDRFESWRYAEKLNVPTIFLVADNDEVIPLQNSQALHQHFKPGIATFKVIKNADHVSISHQSDYFPAMEIF